MFYDVIYSCDSQVLKY